MDIRTKIGSQKYVKTADLRGKPTILVISNCEDEVVGQGRDMESKGVLYFQSAEKGLVLNSTNAYTIGEAYGFETDLWTGKSIELYPTTTEYQGKMVDCLRVRIPVVAPVPAAAPVLVPAAAPVLAPVAAPAVSPAMADVAPSGEVPF